MPASRAAVNRERLLDLAEALAADGGLVQVTVRRLAADSGLATGSLRYVFASQADLYGALAERVLVARQSRLESVSGEVAAQAAASVLSLAPVDESRRREGLVHAALAEVSAPPPAATVAAALDHQVAETCAASVTALTLGRRFDRDRRAVETNRLVALLRGLVVSSRGPEPPYAAVRAVLDRHLEDLLPEDQRGRRLLVSADRPRPTARRRR